MSPSSIALLGLSVITVLAKGAGAMVPHIPDRLARRLTGLAPALLAALVVTDLTGDDGLPAVDEKLAGVAVALVMTILRLPLFLCVVAGAAVTAVMRAVA